jgi:hypothetical protein
MSFNLGLSICAERLFNSLSEERKIIVADWAALACLTDSSDHLFSAKWLGSS